MKKKAKILQGAVREQSRKRVATVLSKKPRLNVQSAGAKPATLTNFNNIITASRMNCAMQCLRQHFWSYEIGLRKADVSIALRIGSAWARAMEARWHGQNYDKALEAAVPEGVPLDEYAMATISALLAAYYDIYGKRETFGKLHPEVQFKSDLGYNGWTAQGVVDGLGSLADGRSGIIESKTTSDSVAPDSGYWLRLNFNLQLYQYITEARKLGWDVATVFYDVTRKPMIQPKNITDLDENKLKIVNKDGARVGIGVGEKFRWKQSASSEAGEVLQSHLETPEEFCDRLYQDALSRPDFYFCRREVPIIDQQLDAFERQRWATIGIIERCRAGEHFADEKRDPDAWPRNVSEHTCDFCQYKTFCLQNISVDLNCPPEGFTVQLNPELKP